MAAASSSWGSSSLTITVSARRAAMAPMAGRLPWSRCPVAPKTMITLDPGSGDRTASRARARASGLWAKSTTAAGAVETSCMRPGTATVKGSRRRGRPARRRLVAAGEHHHRGQRGVGHVEAARAGRCGRAARRRRGAGGRSRCRVRAGRSGDRPVRGCRRPPSAAPAAAGGQGGDRDVGGGGQLAAPVVVDGHDGARGPVPA